MLEKLFFPRSQLSNMKTDHKPTGWISFLPSIPQFCEKCNYYLEVHMFRDGSLHFTIDTCQPIMVTCPFGCLVLHLGSNVQWDIGGQLKTTARL